MFFDDDGRYHFHADLSPELGALLDKTLAEIRDALFRSGRADVTWADAIEELCLRSIATINSASRSDRYRVYVHVDEKGGWLNGGPKVDDSVLHHILCNTVVQPVFEREGRPINLGRTVRTVPDRIARLILDRDRVCRNPMCNATRGLEIHHIVHDANGGPADTWNLGALCPHCHREHHRGRFTIEGNADEPDGLSFRRANGALIEPAGRPNPPIRPLPRPPDDHRYQHPIGERFESKWLSFIPSPEEVAKLKAAAQADDDRPDDWLAERYRQNERYRIGGWT